MYRTSMIPFGTRNGFDIEPRIDRFLASAFDAPVRLGADVEEQDDRAVVSLDIPGVRPEQLSITAEGRTLTVAVDRGERGTYRRQYTIGPKYDLTNVEAKLELGVLTLVLPKAAEAQPRSIAVTVG